MLKFSELTAKDKKRRYKIIVEYSSWPVLLTLIFIGVDYALFSLLLTLLMIINLLFYGVLNKKDNYKYKNLFLDAALLIAINLISALVISPMIVSRIFLIGNYSLSGDVLSAVNLITTILFMCIFWYAVLSIQGKITDTSVKWKWRVTGLFSEPGFDEI